MIILPILVIQACTPQLADTPKAIKTAPPSTEPTVIEPSNTEIPARTIWINPAIPKLIRGQIQSPAEYEEIPNSDKATYKFDFSINPTQTSAIYLLCAPFFTIRDQVTFTEIKSIWKSTQTSNTILVDHDTYQVFIHLWGKAGKAVQVIEAYDQTNLARDDPNTWILIPFQEIRPEWKILRVDGINPLDHTLNMSTYPLGVFFSFQSTLSLPAELSNIQSTIQSNFNPDKLSIVVMTGTTALTRGTAHQMDINGVTWPGKDIRDILRGADITHVSNEVSFYEHCSKGNPNERSLMFCSRPEYLGLLLDVGTDVVELTGNHNLDYGKKSYRESLQMYQQKNILTYAGGLTEEEARQPALFEDHGNKFAFLGCNFVGPRYAMATENSMGAAHCDFEYFTKQITALREKGYLPIFTFQYSEYTIHKPGEHQERDFKRMVDAGAVVVSGSQAHYPQVMTVYQSSFVHYGLGNLFFDQMDKPVKGTREEFIDRHYFYDGRYINTELITALLEDAARPRPMTITERIDFLSRIFADALDE